MLKSKNPFLFVIMHFQTKKGRIDCLHDKLIVDKHLGAQKGPKKIKLTKGATFFLYFSLQYLKTTKLQQNILY